MISNMFDSIPRKIRITKFRITELVGDAGITLPIDREPIRGQGPANKELKAGDVIVCLGNQFFAARNQGEPDDDKDEFYEKLNVTEEFVLLNKKIFEKVAV